MDRPAAGANILVVDDTIENLRLLSLMLTERGHEVRPVNSGRLALQAAASAPPEIVLLDIGMPEMDGFEVCSRLKRIPTLRDVPVIFLTARTDTQEKVKAFATGGADFIIKPFQVEEVLARVDAHVALRRSRAELQESYDRLRALERLRDDMTNMLVHDIRSPLGALTMLLEMVQEEVAQQPDSTAGKSVQTALQAANSINRMVNDLLDVSRMEAGRMPLALRDTDVGDICRDALGLLRALDKTRGMELVATGPAAACCDRNLVRRVVENLVGNAVKHTPSSGHIVVSVAAPGETVRVEVRDNGRGVPPEARDMIFDKYTTIAARSDQKYHSVGLGLTFCKMAVEAHGGHIGVDAAVPHGSVFWFELPVRSGP